VLTTTHPFQLDDTVPADQAERRWCTCGLPESHSAHTLPARPADDRSDHIIGEGAGS
jgi:hypothetical protein